MTSFQFLSTCWKSFPSSGICCRMSSEEKMGSRYSHCACTLSHSSSVSCSNKSRASHSYMAEGRVNHREGSWPYCITVTCTACKQCCAAAERKYTVHKGHSPRFLSLCAVSWMAHITRHNHPQNTLTKLTPAGVYVYRFMYPWQQMLHEAWLVRWLVGKLIYTGEAFSQWLLY